MHTNLTTTINNQKNNQVFFQPKLFLNQPDDIYEQEADTVAEKVIQTRHMQQTANFFKPISHIQRKCAHCEQEEKEKLQRKEENQNEIQTSDAFENYVGGLQNGGDALPQKSKSFFESRMGYDFSNVKIHTDTNAAKSAQSINALAYTTGNNIVFNHNQFQPGTTNGDKLIAHELTHVVQQNANGLQRKIQKQDAGMVDPLDIVEGYTNETVQTIWLDRSSYRTRFFTRGGQTYDGTASVKAEFANGSYIGKLSTSKDKRRTWDLYHADGSVYKGNLEFSVVLNGAVYANLTYTNSIQIEVGEGMLPKLIDIKKRIQDIAKLASETWVDTNKEEKIIRLLSDIPSEQSAEFIEAMNNYSVDGKSLTDVLDDVVDSDENIALHQAISMLRLRSLGEKGAQDLANAPVLPWHDVMGFFEQSATFSIEKMQNGKIKIRYLGAVTGGLLNNPDYKEMSDITMKERINWMISGVEVDPNAPIIIHDYDRDKFVVLTAQDLITYQHAGNRKFIQDMLTIASMATPVGAARTAAGRAFVFTMERVLPALVLVVEENKLNIRKWFPNWGPKIIQATELVKIGLAMYGAAQFVKTGWSAFAKLKQIRNARKAMDSVAIADNASDLSKAESVALQLEQQADELIGPAEKLKKELGVADDIKNAANPINQAERLDPADIEKAKAGILAEQKQTLFTNISDDTVKMFETAEGKKLKLLLEANPDVASFVKYCNSPCFPKLNEAQIGKIRELVRKADIHGVSLNEKVLKQSIHNKSTEEINDVLSMVENHLEKEIRGHAPNLPSGPSNMPSAEQLRNTPGMANGGDSLKVVSGEWILQNQIGRFPKQIADKMRGRSFKDFGTFRQEFWKLVAADTSLSPVDANGKSLRWSQSNYQRMQQGFAPIVSPQPGTGRTGKMTLELDHKLAITNEGGVYDMDNIDIVHKQFHEQVGEK